MKIATISFPVDRNDYFTPTVSTEERRELILNAIITSDADIFLSSGHSLEEKEDVDWLIKKLPPKKNRWIVVECRNESMKSTETREEMQADTWFIHDLRPHNLGTQKFYSGIRLSEYEIDGAAKNVKEKQQKHDAKELMILACGEINLIVGGPDENSRFRNRAVKELFDGIEIVLNFTHDRMPPMGYLSNKRKFLSKSPFRLYVSSSNWNVGTEYRCQNPKADTTHTVFFDGKVHDGKRVGLSGSEDLQGKKYEYREWEIANFGRWSKSD